MRTFSDIKLTASIQACNTQSEFDLGEQATPALSQAPTPDDTNTQSRHTSPSTMANHNARLGSRTSTLLLLAIVAAFCLDGSTAQVPAGTACSSPRVRKSWENYSPAEKKLYIEALGLAMQRGLHLKFVQLHVSYGSELEAHQNCMFIYWHRMYLLGYENMLRSLGAAYACVTIPVWDHLAATARQASGACSSMESCAPIIGDFGGSKLGSVKNLKIDNVTVPSTTSSLCVSNGVTTNFCGNNTGTCPRCIIRGQPSRVTYPGDASFASVYSQVFSYDTWATVARAIESGVHNMVHSQLGGIMSYFQSPVDPLFYTHHAFVDTLQTIYLQCQLGDATATLNATDKSTDNRVWASCMRRKSSYVYNATDEVYMALQNYANKWVHVRSDPNNLLYPYFKDLPAKYADLVDAKDLGVYSYTYELSGALLNMQTNCKASNTIAAATTTLLADVVDARERLASEDAGFVVPSGNEAVMHTGRVESDAESKARRWTIALFESARLNGYNDAAAEEQMEMATCLHKHECIGAVQDYTDIFRQNFHVEGHPRCFTLVRALLSGDKVIGIPRWRAITRRFVPCPNKDKPVVLQVTGTNVLASER